MGRAIVERVVDRVIVLGMQKENWSEIRSNRIRQLQRIITWRDLSERDIANSGIDEPASLNDPEIFPRNAVAALFRYYYGRKETVEIKKWGQAVLAFIGQSDYLVLFFGSEIKKYSTFLLRQGEVELDRQMLERHLSTLGVLKWDQGVPSVGSFLAGNYSYSWPVILFDEYLRVLQKIGDWDLADRLGRQSTKTGKLLDDAVLMIRKRVEHGKPRSGTIYKVIRVKRREIVLSQVDEQSIEEQALAYFADRYGMNGIVAGVEVWRLLMGVLRSGMERDEFEHEYRIVTGTAVPEDLFDFVLHNFEVLAQAISAPNVTFGAVGYPDIILYESGSLGHFMLVEVKDVGDRLRPHQEAMLDYYAKARIPCALLRLTK